MIRRSCCAGRDGKALAWVLISLLMVFGILILCGVFFASAVRVRVRENASGKGVQVETPFGSVDVQAGENKGAVPGLAVYPGAHQVKDTGNATVDLSSLIHNRELRVVAGKWTTPDPIETVQKFYEDKYPEMNVVQHAGKVNMHSGDGAVQRVIELRDLDGGTEISLASIGSPKAN
jgi:hypothetical protein